MDTTWGTDTTFENFLTHIYFLVMNFSFLCVNNCYDRYNKGSPVANRLQINIGGTDTTGFSGKFFASFEKL